MCIQQFRGCVRLVDSPDSTPPGPPAPGLFQTPPR